MIPPGKDERQSSLPQPRRPAPAAQSSARQSTLNRLGVLAATVAALQGGCGDGGGYAVVDPMPTPSRCLGLAATITATAVWKAKEGGGFVVEISLGKPSRPASSYLVSDEGSAWGGAIVSKQITADSVVVTFAPEANSTSAEVSFGAQCAEGQAHVAATLDLSKAPSDGASVPVTLRDEY